MKPCAIALFPGPDEPAPALAGPMPTETAATSGWPGWLPQALTAIAILAAGSFITLLLPWQAAAVGSAVVLAVAGGILAVVAQILLVRLLAWRFALRPGTYHACSRPWRQRRILQRATTFALTVQRLLPFSGGSFRHLRRLGVSVGSGVALAADLCIDDPHLVELGDFVVLDTGVHLATGSQGPDRLRLGRIRIDHEAVIGRGAVIHPNTVVGAGAVVVAGSVVMPDTRIPPGSVWGGHPARPLGLPRLQLQPDEHLVFPAPGVSDPICVDRRPTGRPA